MPDLIQFVDSIDAAPTVRLDLNDEVSFWVKSFSAPPPRLRRSMATNAMRDGVSVGSSSYDGRTLTLEVECRKASQDAAAVEMQKLWRELDRPTNVIRYQPQGASKPVFFRTFRSDASQLADVVAQAAMRTFTVEVLAEPFALGLKETLGPFTVNNDPAAGSNGCYFDATSVLGDVATEPVLWWSLTTEAFRMAVTHTSTAPTLVWTQAESVSLGTNTTNPGGSADAAMSGTGTTNYVRTSFGTAAMATRLTWSSLVARGSFRVVAVVRRSDTTSVMQARWLKSGAVGETTVIPASTGRQIVDLGIVTLNGQRPNEVGYGSTANALAGVSLAFQAERVSGSGTLDWDFLMLVPAGDQPAEAAPPQQLAAAMRTAGSVLIDSTSDLVVAWSGGDPTAGTSVISTPAGTASTQVVGSFPLIYPGLTNRFHLLHVLGGTGEHTKSTTLTVNLAYWPRYLFVRPVSS